MMSKTHVAVGVASSLGLALAFPNSPHVILASVAFGSLGGTTPDVDILDHDYKFDALIGQLISLGICLHAVVIDWILGNEILSYIFEHKILSLFGITVFIALYSIGFFANHRGFTHPLLSLLLFSLAICLIYPPAVPFYAVGYFSHLAIDLLNKSGIQLFFPFKPKPCLKLCYAGKIGNKVLMFVGLGASVILLVMNIIK